MQGWETAAVIDKKDTAEQAFAKNARQQGLPLSNEVSSQNLIRVAPRVFLVPFPGAIFLWKKTGEIS